MRILIIDNEFPPHQHGGIGSYDLILARTLGRFGHFVIVLTGTNESVISIQKSEYGVLVKAPYNSFQVGVAKYIRWIDPLSYAYSMLPVARKLISEFRIDLVEIPSAGGYGGLLAEKLEKVLPVITRFHGSLGKIPIDSHTYPILEREMARVGIRKFRRNVAFSFNSPQWFMERSQIINSFRVTCPSHFSKEWILNNMDYRKNLSVIPNGVVPEEFASFRQFRLKSKLYRKLICFVGRCSVSKGASVLIRSLPKILEEDPQADLLVAGSMVDFKITEQLNFLSERYPGRIILPGRLSKEQLLPLLAKAYCLVHPSFYEISPMAVLEAMALGLPVVASNIGPLPEIVVDQETGLLFQPGDENALADAVLDLLSTGQNRLAEMGESAVSRIDTYFNFNLLIDQQINFYYESISMFQAEKTPSK